MLFRSQGCVGKLNFSAQACMRLCRSPNSNGAGNPHGRRLGQPNFDEVKGGFPPTSGIKKYHIKRKQGRRPGERSRPEYSSGYRYRIKVVQECFFQSSILHAFVQITQLQRSRQPTWEKAWYSQILTKSKGVFP